ncbi:Gp138 family membrane-puncturing spike protein [Mycoavidus sp. SF9855]|uniref:Gp138 family membrane-puncturing spike protein n=1 Tax=Mycoavidus sp. SF9855 TaxID=2968475 RepID=UPI00211B8D17|nr:Gp138 family membrane-puncturing spike protein [Mycoavidus sp. SF9855]UUM20887.1 hypothetical protein NQD60_05235 [Mycoavidus sp. SF9855]
MNWHTPSLDTAIESSIATALKKVHVALPGRIVRFDPSTQTASVQPLIEQVLQNDQAAPLPMLTDVPVQFPRGGAFVMTFPVAPGDECLLIFAERCIDGWFASGQSSIPLDYRLHDLSDGFALMGFSSLPHVIPNLASDAVMLRTLDGSAYFKLDQAGHMTISGTQLTIQCPVVVEQLLTYQAGLSGTGSAAGTTISGNISHSGGELSSNGVTLHAHRHDGVKAGSDVSGGPQ